MITEKMADFFTRFLFLRDRKMDGIIKKTIKDHSGPPFKKSDTTDAIIGQIISKARSNFLSFWSILYFSMLDYVN